MSSRRPLASGLAWAVLAGCGGAEPPPPSPPASPSASPAPVAGASAAPRANPSLLDPPADGAPALAATTGPLPAYPGRFEAVPLPPGMPAILAVIGLRSDDVWMVAAGSTVLHWDGARVSDLGKPRCFTDACCGHLFDCARAPRKCSAEAVKGCGIGRQDCALSVGFDSLRVARGEVVVSAVIDTGGITQALVESRRRKDGRWSCEQTLTDGFLHVNEVRLSPSLRIETPTRPLGGRLGETSVVAGERRVLLPEGLLQADAGLAARADDDLWLWEPTGPHLWHGNGLTWTPVTTGLRALLDVWLTGPASLWALGALDREADQVLLRRDLDQGTWQRFPAVGASRVLRGAGASFWLLGEKAYYHWNGRALHRLEAPLALEDTTGRVWLGPSGDLWVVGASPTAKVKGAEGEVAAGAVYHLPEAKP